MGENYLPVRPDLGVPLHVLKVFLYCLVFWYYCVVYCAFIGKGEGKRVFV